jgi:cell division protease FtsH
VKRVIDQAYERATGVISENLELLHSIAAALLERETLTREDIAVLLRGEKLPPRTPVKSTPSAPTPTQVLEPRRSNPPLLGGPEPAPA